MEAVKRSGKRVLGGEAVFPGPEKDAVVPGAGEDSSAGREASMDPSAGADFDAVPDGAVHDTRASADLRPAEDAAGDIEVPNGLEREDPPAGVESPSAFRKRSAAVQRFERRAEEIARAAQVLEGAAVEEPADLVVRLFQEKRPEIGDERRRPAGNPAEKLRGQDADARVQERPFDRHTESRDSIPFGLKRRVSVGLSVFDGEQCRTPTTCGVCLPQPGKVEIDRGIAVDDEEIFATEPGGGVLQGSGGPEDRILSEELQLGQVHRAIAKVALDFVAEVMEIDARFADALARKP